MNIFASFEPIFMWFWDEIPHPWGFTQLWVFTQWWEANENWLFQFWPITGVLTQWWGTNRIVFLPGGKWSDWLRVICFVFKIVVPKHRFCKLQTFETFVSLEAITNSSNLTRFDQKSKLEVHFQSYFRIWNKFSQIWLFQ